MGMTFFADDLKMELNKLRHLAPKRMRKGRKKLNYADIVWFLLEHYRRCEKKQEFGK